MDSPKVSVIVPAYNCETYIERCLESLLGQSLCDLEIVAVDDGSTDRTGFLLDVYASQHDFLRVIHQKNAGVAAARNAGLAAVRGQYIGFVDADDYIELNMYEELYRCALSTQADLCMCDYDLVYTNAVSVSGPSLPDQSFFLEEENDRIAFYLQYLAQRPVLWNKLYRREAIERAALSFELDSGEDYLFNLMLLPQLQRIALVSNVLYHYVQRGNSVVHGGPCRCNEVAVQLLAHYRDQPSANRCMTSLLCAQLVTGFLFSPHAQGKPVRFFLQQIRVLQQSPAFAPFCTDLAAGRLEALYRTGDMSHKFYWILRGIAKSYCHGRGRAAAWKMYFAAGLISKRNRGVKCIPFA